MIPSQRAHARPALAAYHAGIVRRGLWAGHNARSSLPVHAGGTGRNTRGTPGHASGPRLPNHHPAPNHHLPRQCQHLAQQSRAGHRHALPCGRGRQPTCAIPICRAIAHGCGLEVAPTCGTRGFLARSVRWSCPSRRPLARAPAGSAVSLRPTLVSFVHGGYRTSWRGGCTRTSSRSARTSAPGVRSTRTVLRSIPQPSGRLRCTTTC